MNQKAETQETYKIPFSERCCDLVMFLLIILLPVAVPIGLYMMFGGQ